MTTYVLYHDDADGYASAMAAYMVYEDRATYISVQYGQAFPIDNLTKSDNVFILDFSYKKEILEEVHSKVALLVVLDHHETAMQDLDHLDYAIFDMSKSGARLSWEYFHPDISVPILVKLVEDRDLWKFDHFDTKAFDAGMRATGQYKNIKFWKEVLLSTSLYGSIVTEGRVLVKNLDGRVNSFVKNPDKYKLVSIGEHIVAVYNTTTDISELGNVFNQHLDIDYSISYFFTNKGELVLSYRGKQDGPHVGELCKALGGGGHAAAAGCKLDLVAGAEWLKKIYG